MAFRNEVPGLWDEAIKPAIEDAGYKAIRIDKIEHNRSISDEIIALIRGSRFVVADFTHQNQGVYFEAGFAYGLGRNVIWMCSESNKDELHFDTRQYAHIMYKDINDAKLKLKNRIEAIEGHGSYIHKG
jgi:nucleoside 2-deoxyribosyltransferase